MTEFNYDYAADVYDIISKMDDDTAGVFTQFVTYDVLMNDIEANRRTLDSLTGRIVKSIRDEVSKSLLTDDSPESIASAALVGTVAKSFFPDDPKTSYWDARDASGQFVAANGSRPSAPGTKTSVTFSREKVKAGDKKARRLHASTSPHGADFNLTSALDSAGRHGSEFSDQWTRASNDGSTNSHTYARIKAGSHLLGVLPGSPALKAAGLAGEFVGQYGPQAEMVVGPSIRSTAYRYRGTERKIDPSLSNFQRLSVVDAARAAGVDRTEVSPQMRQKASREAAIKYFNGSVIDGQRTKSRLPKKELAELQASSGKLPPSEGVIIDRDGKVITQATGYMEDHYLPFNLKNLKGLKDGAYVRTRSTGGLTTEDIYTGLVAGADSVTVVSNSGVFTVNFDKDFKGGRRYNDKAARMVTQYGKTLDAIKSEQVSRRGLSQDERLQIRDDVEEELGNWASQSEISARIKEKEKEFKNTPELTKAEMVDIEAKSKDAYPDDARKQRGVRMDLIDAKMEEKSRNKYRLDGEGYATALDAMQEQFPYYIDSTTAVFKDPQNVSEETKHLSGSRDKGYVKPKHNRPEAAREGYFDPTITGRGKISADKTNYQNHANRGSHSAKEPEEAKAAGIKTPIKVSPKEEMRSKIAHARAQGDADKALQNLVEGTMGIVDDKAFPMLSSVASGKTELKDIVSNPARKEAFDMELASAGRTIAADGTDENKKHFKTLKDTYDLSRMQVGGKEFDPDSYRFGDSPSTPFQYADDGPAYQLNSDPAVYKAEWDKLEKKSGMTGQFLAGRSDEELQKTAKFFGTVVHGAKTSQGDAGSNTELLQALASSAPDMNTASEIADRLGSPSQSKVIEREYSMKVDAIERMRRIKAVSGSEAKDFDAPKSKAVDFSAVPGHVISSTTQKMDKGGLMTMARQAAAGYGTDPDKTATYNDIYQAIKSDDQIEDITDLVDELPESEASFWKASLKQAGYDV